MVRESRHAPLNATNIRLHEFPRPASRKFSRETNGRRRRKMEPWTPLFGIFLSSPTPETDASRWLLESFSPSSTSASAAAPITTASFLSLLAKAHDAVAQGGPFPSSPPPARTRRVMFIQTLPAMVQSRILSFLALEHRRFRAADLSGLARGILGGGEEVDFWVEKAAQHLLDVLPESSYEGISRLGLDSGGERSGDEFGAVPAWLKNEVAATRVLLPWLPVSLDEFNSAESFPDGEKNEELLSEAGEIEAEPMDEDVEEICDSLGVPLEPEIQDEAMSLRTQIANFESTSRTVALANAIRKICLGKGLNSVQVLELIEPWKADDEAASILISHLTDGSEKEFTWPSLVLCSVILPRLLVLEVPVTRVLLTATIEYCKLHQKATEYALLLPLMMRKEGINNPVCEAITRIIKECLHPAHVTAFCHKLLCDGKNNKRFVCLPSHQCLISPELVWTESLFNLFQNLLNYNIHLTQGSVDCIIDSVQKLSLRFSKSLKFGNFLLCLVTKCSSSLKSHKQSLTKAVECTNTLVTKSILSKLSNL